MPMYIRMPRNFDIINEYGGYRSYLNVLDRKKTSIQQTLRHRGSGGYEPNIQAVVLSIAELCSRRVLFDVGAGIGYYSAIVSTMFSKSGFLCIGFEPIKEMFDININVRDKNNLNYIIYNKIVSTTQADSINASLPLMDMSSNVADSDANQMAVDKSTIDRVVMEGVPPPGFIKISREVSMWEVVEGGWSSIEKCRPYVLCETKKNTEVAGVSSGFKRLINKGYVLYRIDNKNKLIVIDYDEAIRSLFVEDVVWFMSPRRMKPIFFSKFQVWKKVLKECGPETNIMVNSGELPPDEVRQSYNI